jgi:hypothetical protein
MFRETIHVLSNLREIKVTLITRHESREGDQKFGQWGVDVHEISGLDISRGELAKMYFVESGESCSRIISVP